MKNFSAPIWHLIGSMAERVHLERWATAERLVAVLFHHVTDDSRWRRDDPLTRGLGVDISVSAFEHRIRWLIERYKPISLDDVLRTPASNSRSSRLLVCFDDGYASVYELAAPILKKFGVPWCFFINGRSVGNKTLPVDNMVAYIANVHGTKRLSKLAGMPVQSARRFIGDYLCGLEPAKRRTIIEELAFDLGIDTNEIARNAQLFVTEQQIRMLAQNNVEIGNHTFDHAHCRTLNAEGAVVQVDENARIIEQISGKPVRAFAYPYGSLLDATPTTRAAVKRAGHQCAFVVQNRTNLSTTDRYALFRVDLSEMDDSRAALELEILPRMRSAVAMARAGFRQ